MKGIMIHKYISIMCTYTYISGTKNELEKEDQNLRRNRKPGGGSNDSDVLEYRKDMLRQRQDLYSKYLHGKISSGEINTPVLYFQLLNCIKKINYKITFV